MFTLPHCCAASSTRWSSWGPLISLSLTPITLLLTALQTHHKTNTHTPRRSFRPYDSLAVTRTASGTVSSTPFVLTQIPLNQKALLL